MKNMTITAIFASFLLAISLPAYAKQGKSDKAHKMNSEFSNSVMSEKSNKSKGMSKSDSMEKSSNGMKKGMNKSEKNKMGNDSCVKSKGMSRSKNCK